MQIERSNLRLKTLIKLSMLDLHPLQSYPYFYNPEKRLEVLVLQGENDGNLHSCL